MSPGALTVNFAWIVPADEECMGIWLKSYPKRDALSMAELNEGSLTSAGELPGTAPGAEGGSNTL
jgi:hypothetical protein